MNTKIVMRNTLNDKNVVFDDGVFEGCTLGTISKIEGHFRFYPGMGERNPYPLSSKQMECIVTLLKEMNNSKAELAKG